MSRNKRKAGGKAPSVQSSGYSHGGASFEKNTLKSWAPQHYSAKSDIDFNLQTLRARSADLALNSPLGAAAISTMTQGALSSGLKLYPKPKFKELGLTAEQAREWSRKVALEFDFWASSCHCDWYRRNNFFELQQILFVNYLIDGDAFVLFKRRFATEECPYSLRLQAIEAQRVSNPQGEGKLAISPVEMQGTRTGGKIINGVEVDKNGRLLAVWISNKIWNEPTTLEPTLKWKRVKVFGETTGCRNVLQICKDTRIDQYRGVPFLAPVIETLKQVARYADSELAASIIKTFFAIFFTQPLGGNLDFKDILSDAGADPREPVVDVTDYRLGQGVLNALPRGVDVKAIDRSNAQDSFQDFVNAFVKFTGAALGLPYEVLLKNFQASYSASKAALIQAEEEFRSRRNAFIVDFCQPVFEMFLSEAVALGRIQAPGFFDDPLKHYCWSRCDFRTETSHLLDPVKEINAAKTRIELGLSTHEREASVLVGTDFFESVEELMIENQLLAEANNDTGEQDILRGLRSGDEGLTGGNDRHGGNFAAV